MWDAKRAGGLYDAVGVTHAHGPSWLSGFSKTPNQKKLSVEKNTPTPDAATTRQPS